MSRYGNYDKDDSYDDLTIIVDKIGVVETLKILADVIENKED